MTAGESTRRVAMRDVTLLVGQVDEFFGQWANHETNGRRVWALKNAYCLASAAQELVRVVQSWCDENELGQ